MSGDRVWWCEMWRFFHSLSKNLSFTHSAPVVINLAKSFIADIQTLFGCYWLWHDIESHGMGSLMEIKNNCLSVFSCKTHNNSWFSFSFKCGIFSLNKKKKSLTVSFGDVLIFWSQRGGGGVMFSESVWPKSWLQVLAEVKDFGDSNHLLHHSKPFRVCTALISENVCFWAQWGCFCLWALFKCVEIEDLCRTAASGESYTLMFGGLYRQQPLQIALLLCNSILTVFVRNLLLCEFLCLNSCVLWISYKSFNSMMITLKIFCWILKVFALCFRLSTIQFEAVWYCRDPTFPHSAFKMVICLIIWKYIFMSIVMNNSKTTINYLPAILTQTFWIVTTFLPAL